MTRIQKILLPFALLLGACDPADAEVSEAELAADDEVVAQNQSPDTKGKRGGKLARLDADKDGAISLAEAQGTRLADKFGALDRDADGKLTRDELHAIKGMRGDKGRRGRGGHEMKDPAERAAKILAMRDADKNGSLSAAELMGSRMADRFAALDTNKDGSLAKDELMAIKGRGHGPRGERRDPAERAAKIFERRDADKSGSLSAAEVEGSRMADKFAAIDADKNGAVTRDELVAFKAAHGRRDAK